VYDIIISKATRVTNEAERGHDIIHGSQSLVNLSPYFIESLVFNRAVRAPPASPSPCHSSEPINPGLKNTIIGRAASTRSTCQGGWSHPHHRVVQIHPLAFQLFCSYRHQTVENPTSTTRVSVKFLH
jgi:hypothetical protein